MVKFPNNPSDWDIHIRNWQHYAYSSTYNRWDYSRDSNLVAENIRKWIEVWWVTWTLEPISTTHLNVGDYIIPYQKIWDTYIFSWTLFLNNHSSVLRRVTQLFLKDSYSDVCWVNATQDYDSLYYTYWDWITWLRDKVYDDLPLLISMKMT